MIKKINHREKLKNPKLEIRNNSKHYSSLNKTFHLENRNIDHLNLFGISDFTHFIE